jgi:type VII secretion protein EccE
MSVLGVRAGHLLAWQLIAVAGAVALVRSGPIQWVLGGAALLGVLLTVPRWHHRWAYEWLGTTWGFRRARRAYRGQAAASPGMVPGLPGLVVTSTKVRSCADAGVVHDGDGFAVMLTLRPKRTSSATAHLPIASLAPLLDPADDLVSAVQVVMQDDLAASDPALWPATAYTELGYHRVPRSQSAWVAVRHDPRAAASSHGAAPRAADQHASLIRTLAGRGLRVTDLTGDLVLSADMVGAASAREFLRQSMLVPEPARAEQAGAVGPAVHRWESWNSPAAQHVTYWLSRWPAAGIHGLQQALAVVPALSVTTAVTMTRGGRNGIALTVTIRVCAELGADGPAIAQAVATAAASCGARLVSMDGDHASGVLATLPIGRGPATAAGWAGRHAQAPGSLATVLSVTPGGVVLGEEAGAAGAGKYIALPAFAAAAGTHSAVIGDRLLPRLLALRALAAGARLHVVTAQPDGWLALRGSAGVPPGRMAVGRPGTSPPPDGTSASPWMIIDETRSPGPVARRPWQATVTVLGSAQDVPAAVPSPDAVLLQRATSRGAAAVIAALGLSGAIAPALERMPEDVVAVVTPGSVRFAGLAPHRSERAALTQSLRQPAATGS